MAKKILILYFILFIGVLLFSQSPPDTLWTRTFGGIEDDVAYSVIETGTGDFVLVGSTGPYYPFTGISCYSKSMQMVIFSGILLLIIHLMKGQEI